MKRTLRIYIDGHIKPCTRQQEHEQALWNTDIMHDRQCSHGNSTTTVICRKQSTSRILGKIKVKHIQQVHFDTRAGTYPSKHNTCRASTTSTADVSGIIHNVCNLLSMTSCKQISHLYTHIQLFCIKLMRMFSDVKWSLFFHAICIRVCCW